ncbi:hypothetical protein G6F70_000897 [Rhizopus microsporus]|nr:hypothetical protein G6F71_004991 [Rhizopus microsporus]KAG1203990.1 hypothetical protein G6F70_000897 [Rhizopus microsporus]KAG1214926.1 hypothetical protein G6F69_001506 [Rhizopus microsporus]KAG1237383.1 hypothetical protein G6F67_001277 [Rhizopus microsporus]KAG1258746.1 hypothetical protein G6F68_008585 [Rhizopus microsporus]
MFAISTQTTKLYPNGQSSHILKDQLFRFILQRQYHLSGVFKQDVSNHCKETPVDIIQQVINDKENDDIFLLVYRKFMTPNDLLQQLVKQFGEYDSPLTSEQESPLYERIIALTSAEPPEVDRDASWGVSDDGRNETLGTISEEGDIYLPMRRSKSTQIKSSATNKEPTKRFSTPAIPLLISPGIKRTLTKRRTLANVLNTITVKDMAEQLTWIETELYSKIQPRDFLRHIWRQRQDQPTPIAASIEHFNFVSEWIASMIVNQDQVEERVFVYEYCLAIAVELEKLNNFNTLMAVLAGINNAAILRLKETKHLVFERNKRLVEKFSRLESLMSSERSFYNYRCALKERSKSFGIPGIHQQDLVSLCEANKDHKTNGKIHWQKFRLIGQSINEVMTRFESMNGRIKPNPFILYFIGNELEILTEDERYEKSIRLEPRELHNSFTYNNHHSSHRWLMLRT